MKRCNPPFHARKNDDGFVVMDVDREMLAKGPMSAAKAIAVADEMNQPFLKEQDMEMEKVSNNPELLTVGLNPRRKKRSSKRRSSRRRRRNPTVTYRGKRYKGFLALLSKFGKGAARKIWKSKRKGIGHNPGKKKGKKSNWKALVKKYGVKGAMKHRRGR